MEEEEKQLEVQPPPVDAAEMYAAEALAADMDPWVTFDARRTPRAEFESWLQSNRPSQVLRYGSQDGSTGPVGWICVFGPDFSDDYGDVDDLQEDWERLLASGRPVTYETVKELAMNHGVLSGKWLMHLETGFKVDHAWECIARAVQSGAIMLAKVSTRDPTSADKHVICAYTRDFTDEEQIMRLDGAIRAAGIKCPLSFKPDAYTYLGIYRRNRWGLYPTIYESKFDLERVPRRSLVTNKITNKEVI